MTLLISPAPSKLAYVILRSRDAHQTQRWPPSQKSHEIADPRTDGQADRRSCISLQLHPVTLSPLLLLRQHQPTSTMPVRLRLARYGTRNNPFYHLVAIADYKPRDARPIEKLGEYDPIPRVRKFKPPPFNPDAPVLSSGLPHAVNVSALSSSSPSSGVAGETAKEKRLEWNTERIKYWLRVGAQPSKPVARMLDRVRDRRGFMRSGKLAELSEDVNEQGN